MAIFFLRASIITRAKGQSAIARAAYNGRQSLKDEKTGETKDYSKREGLIAHGIEAPINAPEWAKDREALWNNVEKCEKRIDAQLAKQYIAALPCELTNDENAELAKRIAKTLCEKGMIVDWALHTPSDEGDERNVHGHFLATMRDVETDGFGKKNRTWNDRNFYVKLKIEIAEIINEKLREKGIPEIDGRSYDEQNEEAENIEDLKVGQKHRGYKIVNMERRLKRIDKQIAKLEEMGYGDSDAGLSGIDRPHRSGDNEEQSRYKGDARNTETEPAAKPEHSRIGEIDKNDTGGHNSSEAERRKTDEPIQDGGHNITELDDKPKVIRKRNSGYER